MLSFKTRNHCLNIGQKKYIMAVINLTPDSFYANSRHSLSDAVLAVERAVAQGADIIDIGAQSTAPDSHPITAEQELERLIEPFRAIRRAVDVPISIDTFFPQVAQAALENGADIINDVSGRADSTLLPLAAEYSAGYIAMHTGGSTSKEPVKYENGVIADINSFFRKILIYAADIGLDHSHICLDPGIGFGKSREDDLEIITGFSMLEAMGCATLAALSHKRVTKLCGDSHIGTALFNASCLFGGADIIRVHDIEAAVATINAAQLIIKAVKNDG